MGAASIQRWRPGPPVVPALPEERDSGVRVLGISLIIGFAFYTVHSTITLVIGLLAGWLLLIGISAVLTPTADDAADQAQALTSLTVSAVALGVALLLALIADVVAGLAALRRLDVVRQRGLMLAIIVTLVVAWLLPVILIATTMILWRTDLHDLASLAAWVTVAVILLVLPTLRFLLLTAGIVLLATSRSPRSAGPVTSAPFLSTS